MSDNNIYVVYETTNLINGKFYIGVHKNNNKKYFGSGKILKQSIKKYGEDSFIFEIIKEFNNRKDAFDYERIIVNKKMVDNPNCYNIMIGGCGGFMGYGEDNPNFGNHWSESLKHKMSILKSGDKHHMYGKFWCLYINYKKLVY